VSHYVGETGYWKTNEPRPDGWEDRSHPTGIDGISFDEPCVAVFGSGPSILDMTLEEMQEVKSKCFVVMMNYATARFGQDEMDMLAFHDAKVASWLAQGNLKPGVLLWASKAAFPFGQPAEVMDMVNCWFRSSKGNFALTNIIHDLRIMKPEKKVLLFGVDFKVGPGDELKWYDRYTNADKEGRGVGAYEARCFMAQDRELKLVDAGGMVWNCTPGSALDVFPKEDWRKVA